VADVGNQFSTNFLPDYIMQPEDELPFFQEALNIITEQCGNVVQWYIHHDERLVHMHCFVVSDCEIDTERLNNVVQMAALDKFGVSLTY